MQVTLTNSRLDTNYRQTITLNVKISTKCIKFIIVFEKIKIKHI